jgi:ketosteroid isomerase-like protein
VKSLLSRGSTGNGDVIRRFYEARAAHDEAAIRSVLSEDVVWHESGDFDYSGTHSGREAVLALLNRLASITGGTFRLEARDLVESRQHAAAVVHWYAERSGHRIDGQEIAVYRIEGGRITTAWFFPDVSDQDLHSQVFSFDEEV